MSERYYWTDDRLDLARRITAECITLSEAATRVSAALGRHVTPNALMIKLQRSKGRSGSELLGSNVPTDQFQPVGHSMDVGAYDVISNEQDMSFSVHVADPTPNDVTWDKLAESLPEPGSWSVFALWADLHIGSDDCNEQAIRDFQKYAYEMGARDFLCAGDWCDGSYTKRGGQHEQCYIGLDEQIKATLGLLDQRPGVRHWVIDGNHEHTFYVAGGARPGEALESSAIRLGRSDIHHLGYPSGQVTLKGIKFELTHYKSGVRRAPVNHFQSKMDFKIPDVLVGGHYHIYDATHVRKCLCIQPGAFQNETDFMRGSEFHPTGGTLLYVHHHEKGNRYLTEFRDYTPMA